MTDLEISHLSKQCYRLIWDGKGLEAVEHRLATETHLPPEVRQEILSNAENWFISYKLQVQKKEGHLIKALIGVALFVFGLILYFSIDTQNIATNIFRYGGLVGGAYLAWRGYQAWRAPLEEKPFRAPDPEYIFRGFGHKKL